MSGDWITIAYNSRHKRRHLAYWRIKASLLGLDPNVNALRTFGPRRDVFPVFLRHTLVKESAPMLLKGIAILRPYIISVDGNRPSTFFEPGIASTLFRSIQDLEAFLTDPGSVINSEQLFGPRWSQLRWSSLQSGGHLRRIGTVSIVCTGPHAWDLALMVRNLHSGHILHKPAVAQQLALTLSLALTAEVLLVQVVTEEIERQGPPLQDAEALQWFLRAKERFEVTMREEGVAVRLEQARNDLADRCSTLCVARQYQRRGTAMRPAARANVDVPANDDENDIEALVLASAVVNNDESFQGPQCRLTQTTSRQFIEHDNVASAHRWPQS